MDITFFDEPMYIEDWWWWFFWLRVETIKTSILSNINIDDILIFKKYTNEDIKNKLILIQLKENKEIFNIIKYDPQIDYIIKPSGWDIKAILVWLKRFYN